MDKLRFIPVLNLATLWWYAVESLRYPGWVSRLLKGFAVLVGGIAISGLLSNLMSWTPTLVRSCMTLLCLYGIVVADIYAIRNDVLQQKRLWTERHR